MDEQPGVEKVWTIRIICYPILRPRTDFNLVRRTTRGEGDTASLPAENHFTLVAG